MDETRRVQPEEAGPNRFAFVIHPLNVGALRKHPLFRWARSLPDGLLEPLAARLPPFFVSRVTGARSPRTGQRIEGDLIALGATPRQIMKRGPGFTYRRLTRAAMMAERRGARLMGLGAFTSVVGDAGITVASKSPIAVTSGNSLTVSATLGAAKQACRKMGMDPTRLRAMIIGATGSIGSICARMIAQVTRDVVLGSIEPRRLIDLECQILSETPGARVVVAMKPKGFVRECDVIVSATSAFGERVLDISECKPGAIVCDVARPPDITPAEAALRPDVLIIESGEVLIPGEVDFGIDIGLPPGVAYACLAETALLAMEGRFESFTLGRELEVDKIKEIYRMFRKHGFKLAGLRSLGECQTDADLEVKRALAARFSTDTELFERTRTAAAMRLAEIPATAKGVAYSESQLLAKTRGRFQSRGGQSVGIRSSQ
jgi:predicted amino acid dehydrogenase